MDVEEIMDLALAAVEETFSLVAEVSYAPPSGGRSVTFPADYQRAQKTVGYDLADSSSYDPRLDVRKATLRERGITVEQNGIVTFTAEGEEQSYLVLDVQDGAVGTVVLVLGRRAS